ncbi:hypothetical protein ACFWFZ_24610 [Streptomyces sp. NPDC060232]|uniref:hypothetical protein n=1 Tax=Streptomyces sp. NPDC060232 TaxID=3347079 RepID=UPI00366133DA
MSKTILRRKPAVLMAATAAAVVLSAAFAAPAGAEETYPLAGGGLIVAEGTTADYDEGEKRTAFNPAAQPDPCVETEGARVCFEHSGDIIWVKDTKADGLSAVGGGHTNYGRYEGCRNKAGHNKWVKCNFDFAEDKKIRMEAFRYDGDTGLYVYPVPRRFSAWLGIDGRV